jgi:hypothetical protein
MELSMQVETQQRSDKELLSEHPGAPWRDAGEGMRWVLGKKFGFRFIFTYLVLFILTAQEIESIPGVAFIAEKYMGYGISSCPGWASIFCDSLMTCPWVRVAAETKRTTGSWR